MYMATCTSIVLTLSAGIIVLVNLYLHRSYFVSRYKCIIVLGNLYLHHFYVFTRYYCTWQPASLFIKRYIVLLIYLSTPLGSNLSKFSNYHLFYICKMYFLGNLDDKLSLYSHNKTLFTSLEKEDLAAELYTWKVTLSIWISCNKSLHEIDKHTLSRH